MGHYQSVLVAPLVVSGENVSRDGNDAEVRDGSGSLSSRNGYVSERGCASLYCRESLLSTYWRVPRSCTERSPEALAWDVAREPNDCITSFLNPLAATVLSPVAGLQNATDPVPIAQTNRFLRTRSEQQAGENKVCGQQPPACVFES